MENEKTSLLLFLLVPNLLSLMSIPIFIEEPSYLISILKHLSNLKIEEI